VPTNIDDQERVLRQPRFLSGSLHTGFLSEYAEELLPRDAPGAAAAATLAALLADPEFRRAAFEVPEPYASIGPWHN
jgi:hypothetical protein